MIPKSRKQAKQFRLAKRGTIQLPSFAYKPRCEDRDSPNRAFPISTTLPVRRFCAAVAAVAAVLAAGE